MIRFIAAAIAAASLSACAASTPSPRPAVQAEARQPVTILISIDGFRPDYLSEGLTPNLNALAAAGASGAMRPSFPTKTFPNHNTIVTGLRPDRHGIVENNMEDPSRPDVRFSLGSNQARDPFWWNEAEPIWVTAEKAGIRTGTMFWPGSEVAIHDSRPFVWQRYDENIANGQRVETVLDWMRRPDASRRPQFITLYFDTLDTAAHRNGPHSAKALTAAAEIDSQIGALADGLQAMNQPANFIVISDHGMAEISEDRVVRIDEILPQGSYRRITEGAFFTAEAEPGRDAEVAAALLRPHPHMECWRKADIPARFHYGRNPRVASFFCLGENGWSLLTRAPEPFGIGGNHGYDNDHPDMRALFIASGPSFRTEVKVPLFDNVDVYPLLAALIGVSPQANDGDAATLENILVR